MLGALDTALPLLLIKTQLGGQWNVTQKHNVGCMLHHAKPAGCTMHLSDGADHVLRQAVCLSSMG